MDTNLPRNVLALLARFLSGASVRWIDSQPDTCQRVYFANHTSHLDPIMIWSALPQMVRMITRPVAAKDYWVKGPIRRYLANRLFHAILIDREEIKVHQSPVDLIIREIGQSHSLILFPEGGRTEGKEIGEFKSGLYYLCKKRPDLELIPGPHGQHEPHPSARQGAAGADVQLHHVWPADVAGGRRGEGRFSPPGPRSGPAAEGD